MKHGKGREVNDSPPPVRLFYRQPGGSRAVHACHPPILQRLAPVNMAPAALRSGRVRDKTAAGS